jgi:hypothetical protein
MHKEETPHTQSDGLAITSMILGIVSLTGPGLFLGIPAIILAIIAMKNKASNRGFSITGLVTGIISTALSILLFIIMGLFLLWGASLPMHDDGYPYPATDGYEYRSDALPGART